MARIKAALLRMATIGAAVAIAGAAAASPTYAAGTGARLLSQGRPTAASSHLTAASDANDGNMATRWSPTARDHERYLTIDLGRQAAVSTIVLDWGARVPGSFTVRTSPQVGLNVPWTQTLAAGKATGGQQTVHIRGTRQLVGSIRVYCSSACSLREFEVYGTPR